MFEILIVLVVCSFVVVAVYKNHDGATTDKVKETCVFAGLFGAIFALIGCIVAIDHHQSWNNWLTTALIVIAVALTVHYSAARQSSGRHVA